MFLRIILFQNQDLLFTSEKFFCNMPQKPKQDTKVSKIETFFAIRNIASKYKENVLLINIS